MAASEATPLPTVETTFEHLKKGADMLLALASAPDLTESEITQVQEANEYLGVGLMGLGVLVEQRETARQQQLAVEAQATRAAALRDRASKSVRSERPPESQPLPPSVQGPSGTSRPLPKPKTTHPLRGQSSPIVRAASTSASKKVASAPVERVKLEPNQTTILDGFVQVGNARVKMPFDTRSLLNCLAKLLAEAKDSEEPTDYLSINDLCAAMGISRSRADEILEEVHTALFHQGYDAVLELTSSTIRLKGFVSSDEQPS